VTLLLLFLSVALVGIAVALALRAALGGAARKGEILAQVVSYGWGRSTRPTAGEPNAFQSKEIAREIGTRLLERLQTDQIRELRQLLNSAGLYNTTVAQYLGYRALSMVGVPAGVLVLFLLGGSLGVVGVLFVIVAAGIGFVLPKSVVEHLARKRTERIDYEVPELVDLLVTTIEAGIGFGSALQLSARRVRDPLGSELRLTLGEQSMGLTMNEALQNMLERTNRSASMRAFVQAIVQGETMGVSMGRTLRDLAVDMRKRRKQAAEEKAQKAPIKLLFPLTFLILPAMMIVILTPAVRAIAHGLGGGF
jgi:tight adherence protein C